MGRLILSRRCGEEIVLDTSDGLVVVQVARISDGRVRLAVMAPAEVPVHRRHVFDAIHPGRLASEMEAA